MYVQTAETPNPNTLKFLPGKTVSEVGSIEFTAKEQTENGLINEYYLKDNVSILDKNYVKQKSNDKEPTDEVVKKIISILDEKIRPAVARDGGDIKFKSFDNGLVTVELQGSCSGCPSSVMTLKQGVQNLLCHYVSEVKRVEAVQDNELIDAR